jgi:hypothetical protein
MMAAMAGLLLSCAIIAAGVNPAPNPARGAKGPLVLPIVYCNLGLALIFLTNAVRMWVRYFNDYLEFAIEQRLNRAISQQSLSRT